MSVEQVARDFITNMVNQDRVQQMITTGAMVDGGVLPQPLPMKEALNVSKGLVSAIPDLRINVQKVTVNGNQATVDATLSGTQSAPLDLPVPGMMPIPVTGKHVSVGDRYIVTVQGDKVSHLTIQSPEDGGIPGVLSQIGAKMPPE